MDSYIELQHPNQLSIDEVSLFNRETIAIEHQSWNKINCCKICQFFKVWRLTKMWIGNNLRPSILNQIKHIDFPNLKSLAIFGNNIESVEGIHRVAFPSLEWINLGENKLTKIANMKKSRWLKIEEIHLYENNIIDLEGLTEFHAKKMKNIGLEWAVENKEIGCDLRWSLKLEMGLERFVIQNDRRIKRQFYETLMLRKEKDIQFEMQPVFL